MRWPSLPLVALVLALCAATAAAQDRVARGTVIKIEQQEIYVSIGGRHGVADGSRLRLKRPVRLRHPVTRAMVDDWLPIGAATITQAGSGLSRAVLGDLATAVKLGDIAEVFVEGQAAPLPAPEVAPEPTPAPEPPTATPPPADPHTLEVLRLFAAQTGQPLDARVAGWERFLSTHASSPYATQIRADLDSLRRLRDELTADDKTRPMQLSVTVRHEGRKRAPAGVALPLVFVLDQPELVASAYLHYRARGARTFHSVLLGREHERYLRGQIPGEVIAAPGIDYFVEVSSPAGVAGLALGSPSDPVRVEVRSPPLTDRFGAAPGRSRMRLSAEYLDFAMLETRDGDRTDRLLAAAIDFTYRVDGVIESLGVGYGLLTGQGGYADRVWTPDAPAPSSGFRYGYVDLTVATHKTQQPLAAALRLIAGVGREGFGLGFEGRLRVGSLDGPNLALVARTIEELGFLSEVRFGAPVSRLVRLGLSVGATDLPARGDTGVRLGTEVHWSATARVALVLGASWQGRETRHGGLGGGGGLEVSW